MSRKPGPPYVTVREPTHPRAHKGQVLEHILVAERALGKHLPVGAEVHHINEDTLDNRPQNLVVCQDRAYHKLLHQRRRALDACGRAGWRKCKYCKEYDAPDNLRRVGISGEAPYHPECARTRYGRKAA